MSSLETFKAHFANDPGSFLIGKATLSVIRYDDDKRDALGEFDVILFSMERIEHRTDLQEYVNVLAYSDGKVLNNVFEHEGNIICNVYDEDYDGPTKNYHLHRLSFVSVTPSAEDIVKILRWKQKIRKAAGVPNPVEVLEAAENKAALKFFNSLFSGTATPEVEHMQNGIELLTRRIQSVSESDPSAPKVGKLARANGVRDHVKIVELFPGDDQLAVLDSEGQTTILPYADVTVVH